MADLFSVISGLQPDAQDVLAAELFVQQVLQAKYPDLDLREGTGIRDLVVRPTAMLLSLCSKGVDSYLSQSVLSGITDSSDQDLVNQLLGNLFLERKTGTYSVVNARLFFARQVAASIPSTASFSTDGSLLFFPASSLSIPSTSLTYDSYSNEYYVDVDLTAEQKGTAYNLASGSLLYFSNFNPYFLRGEINYLAQESTDPETNTQFISRASTAVSTRNLINRPSIESNLGERFNNLDTITSVGSGEEGMYRDLVQIMAGHSVPFTSTYSSWVENGAKIELGYPGNALLVGQIVKVYSTDGTINVPEARIVFQTSARVQILVPTKAVSVGGSLQVALDDSVSIPQWITQSTLPSLLVSADLGEHYAHVGGCADVYIDRSPKSKLSTYTLDGSGRCTVEGAVLAVNSATPIENDTLSGSAYTATKGGSLSQVCNITGPDASGYITASWSGSLLQVGSMVTITGFPSVGSKYLSQVSDVTDLQVVFKTNLTGASSSGSGVVTYCAPEEDFGFSERQEVIIDYGVVGAGTQIEMDLLYYDKVPAVQAYLDSPDIRVLCADYLARGYDLYALDISLQSYDLPLPTSSELSAAAQTYIATIPIGGSFIVSDFLSSMHASGVTGLANPPSITCSIFGRQVWGTVASPIQDELTPLSPLAAFYLRTIQISSASLGE